MIFALNEGFSCYKFSASLHSGDTSAQVVRALPSLWAPRGGRRRQLGWRLWESRESY